MAEGTGLILGQGTKIPQATVWQKKKNRMQISGSLSGTKNWQQGLELLETVKIDISCHSKRKKKTNFFLFNLKTSYKILAKR